MAYIEYIFKTRWVDMFLPGKVAEEKVGQIFSTQNFIVEHIFLYKT